MGSLIRVASNKATLVRRAIQDGIADQHPKDPTLRKLCDNGYFVPTEADEFKLVERILERERRTQGFSLILLPHENCNFRCTYCYEKFERGRMEADVVAGLKRLVDKKARSWGSMAVQWFGGEPLLACEVIETLSDSFLATCQRDSIPYSAGITTNASFLTSDVARMLLDRRVHRFQITLDGPAETHDLRRKSISGKGTYDRVLGNLSALRAQPDQFVVRLRVNFDPDSIDLIEPWIADIAPIFAEDGRFEISFHPIGRWGGPNDDAINVCDEELAGAAKLDLMEAAYVQGFSRGTMRDFLGSHGSSCYAGKDSSVVVGADGQLYKCTVAFDDPRNHVGHITPDGELEIDTERWKLWTDTDSLETGKCTSCWFHASCESRTCPLVALDQGEPPCPSSPDQMQQLVELTTYGRRVGPPRTRAPRRRRPQKVSLPVLG